MKILKHNKGFPQSLLKALKVRKHTELAALQLVLFMKGSRPRAG